MSKRKFFRNREWLYKKYWEEELNLRQIAEICGVCKCTIKFWFNKFDILRRSGSESKMGKKNPNWKGGIMHKNGYVFIRQSNGEYKKKAVIVMEKHLGRKLTPRELVHHKSEVKDDDRIENLELISNERHIHLHMKGKKYKRNCLSLKEIKK